MENLTVVARKERLSKLSAIRLERFHLRYAVDRCTGKFGKPPQVSTFMLSFEPVQVDTVQHQESKSIWYFDAEGANIEFGFS